LRSAKPNKPTGYIELLNSTHENLLLRGWLLITLPFILVVGLLN